MENRYPGICTFAFSAVNSAGKPCPALFFGRVAHFDCPPGTEELGHLEMIGTIVHQLTRNLTEDQIKSAGFDAYFVDHTAGVYPTAASGFPWSAASMAVKGDLIADLTEDLAADGTTVQEQRG